MDLQYVLPVFGPLFFIAVVLVLRRQRTKDSKNHRLLTEIAALVISFIYIMGILSITRLAVIPYTIIERVSENRSIIIQPGDIQIIPFDSITHILNFYGISTVIVGNLFLLFPLGLLLPWWFSNLNGLRISIIILLSSLVIEISQTIFGVGIGNIDDLILNTLGGIIGYALYHVTLKYAVPVTTRMSS
ncbi:VanZ family protein [Guptibacillus algicola]|uniref:VanZ family protein n=1 Tax=Guptibacillus algicola TaxID=225844 RepID=UPI001CD29BB7|nr:VanZ family protein [Alkalihalobacillus algicola]MCA0987254.1 VanZ family protein [Alkalihalobacillus algicola]